MSRRLGRILTVSLLILWGISLIACIGKDDKNQGQPQVVVQQNAPPPPPQNVQNNPATPWQVPPQNAKSVALAKIGDEISFNNDSTWVVLSAENKGNTLKSNNRKPLQWWLMTNENKEKFLKSSKFLKDAETSGKFIVVRYRVCNLMK